MTDRATIEIGGKWYLLNHTKEEYEAVARKVRHDDEWYKHISSRENRILEEHHGGPPCPACRHPALEHVDEPWERDGTKYEGYCGEEAEIEADGYAGVGTCTCRQSRKAVLADAEVVEGSREAMARAAEHPAQRRLVVNLRGGED